MKALFTVALCLSAVLLLAPGSARSVNISDFQINEENYPTIFDHMQQSVADDGSGNYVVTWVDYRAGHPRYYAQLFNWYGAPIGENVLILDDPVGPEPVAVARRSSGDFVVVYVHGDGVYAKMYGASGSVLWGPLLMQHLDWQTCWYCFQRPFVGMSANGHILAGWVQLDTTHAIYSVMGQWLDASGLKVGGPYLLFEPASQTPARLRTVVTDGEGAAVAQMQDNTVQLRFIAFGGAPSGPVDTLATEIGVFGEGARGIPYGIELCRLADGSLCAAWKMQFDSSIQVEPGGYVLYNVWSHDYVRRFSGSGSPLSEVLSLEEEAEHDSKRYGLCLSPLGSGFTIADFAEGDDSTVMVRWYSADGTQQGDDQVITTQRSRHIESGMAQVISPTGQLGFVWRTPGLYYNGEIVRQHFTAAGGHLTAAERVHDDIGANQIRPRVVTGPDGTALVLWIDYRSSDKGELYGQRYDASGQPVGVNFKLNDSGWVTSFAVGTNGTGRTVVVWYDYRGFLGTSLTFARVLDGPSFQTSSPSFLVEPATPEVESFSGQVGVAADSSFVLAYHARTSGEQSSRVFVRKYSSSVPPVPLTERVEVSGPGGGTQPAIGMKPNGEFALTWLQSGYMKPVFQRFNAAGGPVAAYQMIAGTGPCGGWSSPSVAVNGLSEYAVGWATSGCYPGPGSWVALFDASGNQTVNWTRLTSSQQESQDANGISIAVLPDNQFLAAYQDLSCCDSAVWAQRLTMSGPAASRLRINSDVTPTVKQNPHLAVEGSTVLFVWEDYRNGNDNTDIFSRYLDLVGVPGDVDGSGDVDISDLTLLVDYLFLLLQMPPNYWQADMNGDGVVDVGDVTTMVDFLF